MDVATLWEHKLGERDDARSVQLLAQMRALLYSPFSEGDAARADEVCARCCGLGAPAETAELREIEGRRGGRRAEERVGGTEQIEEMERCNSVEKWYCKSQSCFFPQSSSFLQPSFFLQSSTVPRPLPRVIAVRDIELSATEIQQEQHVRMLARELESKRHVLSLYWWLGHRVESLHDDRVLLMESGGSGMNSQGSGHGSGHGSSSHGSSHGSGHGSGGNGSSHENSHGINSYGINNHDINGIDMTNHGTSNSFSSSHARFDEAATLLAACARRGAFGCVVLRHHLGSAREAVAYEVPPHRRMLASAFASTHRSVELQYVVVGGERGGGAGEKKEMRSRYVHHSKSKDVHHHLKSRDVHHSKSRDVHHHLKSRNVHHSKSKDVHHSKKRGYKENVSTLTAASSALSITPLSSSPVGKGETQTQEKRIPLLREDLVAQVRSPLVLTATWARVRGVRVDEWGVRILVGEERGRTAAGKRETIAGVVERERKVEWTNVWVGGGEENHDEDKSIVKF